MGIFFDFLEHEGHQGGSNVYIQYFIFNIKNITLNYPKSAAMGFFQRAS